MKEDLKAAIQTTIDDHKERHLGVFIVAEGKFVANLVSAVIAVVEANRSASDSLVLSQQGVSPDPAQEQALKELVARIRNRGAVNGTFDPAQAELHNVMVVPAGAIIDIGGGTFPLENDQHRLKGEVADDIRERIRNMTS